MTTIDTTITRPRLRRDVNVLADLRASRGQVGDIVVLHGNLAAGDVGAGLFYWDADRTDEDDGVSVVLGWVRLVEASSPALGAGETVRYLRPGGSLSNAGDSADAAWPGTWAGFQQWYQQLNARPGLHRQILDIDGCTISEAAQVNLGDGVFGPISDDYDPAAVGPDMYAALAAFQVRATPATLLAVTVNSTAAGATSGCFTVNVAQVLVASAYKRKFLIGSGLGEWAAIEDNGVGSLKVAQASYDPAIWTAPIRIYEAGATLDFGDPAKPNLPALNLTAYGTWFFTGIHFASGHATQPAITTRGPGEVYLQLSEIDGVNVNGSGYTYMDGCAINGQFWTGGGNFIARNTVMSQLAFLCHKGGAYADFSECLISQHTAPVGGGVSQPILSFAMLRCEVKNGTGDGVAAGGEYVRLTDTLVSGNAGAGVSCNGGGTVRLANVDGTGNTDVGVDIADGSRCQVTAGTTVTGTLGDVRLGSVGIIAWAGVPAADPAQLCRVWLTV